jgi:hypothetical protein
MGVVLAAILWRFLHEPKRGAADLADSNVKKEPEVKPKAVSVQSDRGAFFNVTALIGFVSLAASLFFLMRALRSLAPDAAILATVKAYAPCIILGALGIVLASAAIMLAAWESYRVAAAATLAALYLGTAGFALWKLRSLAAGPAGPSSANALEGALAVARWVAGGVVLYSVARKLNRILR